ncbi:hypothetical protein ABIE18_004105 [Arthrobacter sp. 2762]
MGAVWSGRAQKWLISTFMACSCLLLAGCQTVQITAPNATSSSETAAPYSMGGPSEIPNAAKGDGVADDTAALQAWLDAGGVRLTNGKYRITKGLILAGDNRTLQTQNATIVADGPDITALTVTGNYARVSIHVDGQSRAAYGLKVTGSGAIIENGCYENFRSETQSARGIDASTSGGVIIRNNWVRNIVSVGDKIGGNGPGASRGIGLNSTGDAQASSFITGNTIENVSGEEGDAIHILFFDGTANPFNVGKVNISDNDIRNVSRRFIKVQASYVVVEGNKLHTDTGAIPTNPSAAIDVIRSDNVKVLDNAIDPNLVGNGIAVNGIAKAPLRGIEVRGNVLRESGANAPAGIYLKWTVSPVVRDNTVFGGSAGVQIRSSTDEQVEGNAHNESLNAAPELK